MLVPNTGRRDAVKKSINQAGVVNHAGDLMRYFVFVVFAVKTWLEQHSMSYGVFEGEWCLHFMLFNRHVTHTIIEEKLR
jgi:hypothetical protein